MSTTKAEIKKAAEEDLWVFARLINPTYLYGDIHKEVFQFLSDDNENDLILLPRGHLKSHMIAVWAAWQITRNPCVTIVYSSATDDLANSQLYAIQLVLESDIYRRYWPEMVKESKGHREKWSATEIIVDHPMRKERGVRDATVAARSVGSNTTGLHCDILVLDDIVVPKNAYTIEGRSKVASAYSQFASVKNPDGITKAVGTRYHPQDIYQSMIDMEYELYDDQGNVTGTKKNYRVMQRSVIEHDQFIWPREQHPKTKKWYGFNHQYLARIRSEYLSQGESAQYYAQYFNNPNDLDSNRVSSDKFQYYEPKFLTFNNGYWAYQNKPLTVYAAIDIAYTTGQRSDYTAIAVIGIDEDGYIYILQLDQFRTDKYDVIYNRVLSLYSKWRFRRLRLESAAGSNLVAEYIKDQARRQGEAIIIDAKPAPRDQSKQERIAQILEPKYETNSIFHVRGGYINLYEEQLILARPTHDDLKDAVAMAVEIAKPVVNRNQRQPSNERVVLLSSRFGGYTR